MRHIRPYLNLFKDTANFFRAGKDINILEIGVAKGMSTRAFLEGAAKREENKKLGKVNLYGIDINNVYKNINAPNKGTNWTFINHDSTTYPWDIELDVLFIDGCHSYEISKSDYLRYSPFVKKGGLIYMHDVAHPRFGVKKTWKEIENEKKVILLLNATGLGVIEV